MTQHKAWNWDKANKTKWNEPAPIAYYLAARWKRKGYSRLFDLGCGLGRHSLFFAREGLEVVGRLANPLVTTALVPGGAHDVRRTRPAGFYDAVDPWLAGLDEQ